MRELVKPDKRCPLENLAKDIPGVKWPGENADTAPASSSGIQKFDLNIMHAISQRKKIVWGREFFDTVFFGNLAALRAGHLHRLVTPRARPGTASLS